MGPYRWPAPCNAQNLQGLFDASHTGSVCSQVDDDSGTDLASLSMIRSFSLRIERLEGVIRLSQKHAAVDGQRVAQQLPAQNDGDGTNFVYMIADLHIP